jgi:hypothetical protein
MLDNFIEKCFCCTRWDSIADLPLNSSPCKFVLQREALQTRKFSQCEVSLTGWVVVSSAAAGDSVFERLISVPCWVIAVDCNVVIWETIWNSIDYLIYAHSVLRCVYGFRVARQTLPGAIFY